MPPVTSERAELGWMKNGNQGILLTVKNMIEVTHETNV